MSEFKRIQTLEERVWDWVKNGYMCFVCWTPLKPRFAFNQWKKNYRILCTACETLEQLKEGRGYAKNKKT